MLVIVGHRDYHLDKSKYRVKNDTQIIGKHAIEIYS